MLQLILLSGPLAVGKSSVAAGLIESGAFLRIGSGSYLLKLAAERGLRTDRAALQTLGDRLDSETDYRWLVDDVAVPTIAGRPLHSQWLVDAVRKHRQVEHFRARFGASIYHLHLVASDEVLRRRYEARAAAGGEYAAGTTYDLAIAHPNEVASRALLDIADQVIDVTGVLTDKIVASILGILT